MGTICNNKHFGYLGWLPDISQQMVFLEKTHRKLEKTHSKLEITHSKLGKKVKDIELNPDPNLEVTLTPMKSYPNPNLDVTLTLMKSYPLR